MTGTIEIPAESVGNSKECSRIPLRCATIAHGPRLIEGCGAACPLVGVCGLIGGRKFTLRTISTLRSWRLIWNSVVILWSTILWNTGRTIPRVIMANVSPSWSRVYQTIALAHYPLCDWPLLILCNKYPLFAYSRHSILGSETRRDPRLVRKTPEDTSGAYGSVFTRYLSCAQGAILSAINCITSISRIWPRV